MTAGRGCRSDARSPQYRGRQGQRPAAARGHSGFRSAGWDRGRGRVLRPGRERRRPCREPSWLHCHAQAHRGQRRPHDHRGDGEPVCARPDGPGGRLRHAHERGIELIAADSPQSFIEDTPTARLIRQVLGAVSEFDKAMTVAKLRGARDRKRKDGATRTRRDGGAKVEGRKNHAELRPEAVAEAKRLRRKRPKGGQRSYRKIATELFQGGYWSAESIPRWREPGC